MNRSATIECRCCVFDRGKPVRKESSMKTLLFPLLLATSCLAQQPPAKSANPAFQALVREARAHIKHVDIHQFRALRETHPDLLVIDVRETEEWAKGRASGAIHISKGLIERDVEAKVPDKAATVVLYCHSGARSALAAENLMRMGYSNVYSLDGGFTAYEAAGLRVDK